MEKVLTSFPEFLFEYLTFYCEKLEVSLKVALKLSFRLFIHLSFEEKNSF
jgi:hypothetical protein